MKNFKIIASTNGYIAQRDVMFEKGKTKRVLIDNLTDKEAHEKLVSFCQQDYENSYKIETLEEFVKEFMANNHFFSNISDQGNEDFYFESTKKRWLFLYEKRKELFFEYTGPGIYENGNCIMNLEDNSYEYDSRYFSIQEEVTEEN